MLKVTQKCPFTHFYMENRTHPNYYNDSIFYTVKKTHDWISE